MTPNHPAAIGLAMLDRGETPTGSALYSALATLMAAARGFAAERRHEDSAEAAALLATLLRRMAEADTGDPAGAWRRARQGIARARGHILRAVAARGETDRLLAAWARLLEEQGRALAATPWSGAARARRLGEAAEALGLAAAGWRRLGRDADARRCELLAVTARGRRALAEMGGESRRSAP